MSSTGDLRSTLEQDLQQLLTQELQTPAEHDGQARKVVVEHNSPSAATDALRTGHNDLYQGNTGDKDAEDYANFENWIPTFVKPGQPCDYCRSKGLDCHMYFGKITCTACNSLFRSCSFARVSRSENDPLPDANKITTKYTQHVDTLHTVQEDICTERGAYTGTKTLRSKTTTNSDDGKKSAVRFSRAALKILRDWFEANQDHPYPTDEEKIDLINKTGLNPNQVTTWLANTRRRSKVGKGPRRSYSPGPSSRSKPITVPAAQMAKEWRDLNPFERWQHSPPENEPAPMEAIADAVKSSNYLPEHSRPSSGHDTGSREQASSSASFSGKPASVASMETGRESSGSRTNTTSSIAWSHGSSGSFGSFNSFGSGLHGKRDRGRRKRKVRAPLRKEASDDKKRIFQCTFCTDAFKTKYDWTRHEKTLHLSLEKWICAPLGPVVTDPTTGIKTCVYCRSENPSKSHLDEHGHSECESKGLEARTFYRKDHLRQHLRLMHHTTLQPMMESWKASADFIKSRCGFCDARFTSWIERNDHLAAHFREGAHMRDWKRCRGLDPDVAANVLNAMPPYLIGMERDSPVPFSASRGILSHQQMPMVGARPDDPEGWPASETLPRPPTFNTEKATCWEILTISLGQYVKAQADAGVVLTDDMLQAESRRILYGDDDAWNQTAADNPEWLDLFKKAHGLDIIPDKVNGVGKVVPEDWEFYGNLGLRIPFNVAQRAIANQQAMATPESAGLPQSAPTPSLLTPQTDPDMPAVALVRTSFGTPEEQLRRWAEYRRGGPAAYEMSYRSYDELPIPASRAAHFAAPPRNPPSPNDGVGVQSELAQEADGLRQLTPEEEQAWSQVADEFAASQLGGQEPGGGMAGFTTSAMEMEPSPALSQGDFSQTELDQMMSDFGMGGMDLGLDLSTTGTGSQTPSSGSQMLNTPLTGDVSMFDPFTFSNAFSAGVGKGDGHKGKSREEQWAGDMEHQRTEEADPMQWVNFELMDDTRMAVEGQGEDVQGAEQGKGRQERDAMTLLREFNDRAARDMEMRGVHCGGVMGDVDELDFGEIQF
ncbi:homeobox KN domain-containing protein 2 [Elsinoe australis]|uniref:Homeobox KN domain-containing protein 2 n=1 Tax=Elsinoe australis TaxID=40998 RepID=A0A4U7B7H7_9PEZI|nr:homeobox KN domain-containing protein 2 [Elsinoe australis]